MRSWVFRNRARLAALYERSAPAHEPAGARSAPQVVAAREKPGEVVLVPARRRGPERR